MAAISLSCSTRSIFRVQQMHPFCRATRLSSFCPTTPPCSMSAASIFTSPMSLTMTANFIPFSLLSMRLSNVVFPLPRYPVSSSTGKFFIVPMCVLIYKLYCFDCDAFPPGVPWGEGGILLYRCKSTLFFCVSQAFRGIIAFFLYAPLFAAKVIVGRCGMSLPS